MTDEITNVIETLRPYTGEVPVGAPPEILPWEPDDKWALDGAARRALAAILEGAGASTETYAIADYLLTFNSPGYKGRFHPS